MTRSPEEAIRRRTSRREAEADCQSRSMDSLLITIVVIAIAALSNWLQQRAQRQQEQAKELEPDHTPAQPGTRRTVSPPAVPRPLAESTLERELRRLLGDDDTLTPPRQRPHAPEPPRPVPPPVVTLPPHAPQAPPPIQVASSVSQNLALAQARAQQLQHEAGERLRQTREQAERLRRRTAAQPVRRGPSELSGVYAISHDPEAARRAFVASLIFGLPKALKDEGERGPEVGDRV